MINKISTRPGNLYDIPTTLLQSGQICKFSQNNPGDQNPEQQSSWLAVNYPYLLLFTGLGLLGTGLYLYSRQLRKGNVIDENYEKELSRLSRRRNLRTATLESRALHKQDSAKLNPEELDEEQILELINHLRKRLDMIRTKADRLAEGLAYTSQIKRSQFHKYAQLHNFVKTRVLFLLMDGNLLRKTAQLTVDITGENFDKAIRQISEILEKDPGLRALLIAELQKLLQSEQMRGSIVDFIRRAMNDPEIMKQLVTGINQQFENNPELRKQIFSMIISHINEAIKNNQLGPEANALVETITKLAVQNIQNNPQLAQQAGNQLMGVIGNQLKDVLKIGAPLGIGVWIMQGLVTGDFSISSLISFSMMGMLLYGVYKFFFQGNQQAPQANQPPEQKQQPDQKQDQQQPGQGQGQNQKPDQKQDQQQQPGQGQGQRPDQQQPQGQQQPGQGQQNNRPPNRARNLIERDLRSGEGRQKSMVQPPGGGAMSIPQLPDLGDLQYNRPVNEFAADVQTPGMSNLADFNRLSAGLPYMGMKDFTPMTNYQNISPIPGAIS